MYTKFDEEHIDVGILRSRPKRGGVLSRVLLSPTLEQKVQFDLQVLNPSKVTSKLFPCLITSLLMFFLFLVTWASVKGTIFFRTGTCLRELMVLLAILTKKFVL